MSEQIHTPKIVILKRLDIVDKDIHHLSMKLKVKTEHSETLVTLIDLHHTNSDDWLKLLTGDHILEHQYPDGMVHIESSGKSIIFKVTHYSNHVLGLGIKQHLKINKSLCQRFIIDVAREVKDSEKLQNSQKLCSK